jgi:hypothetical protein
MASCTRIQNAGPSLGRLRGRSDLGHSSDVEGEAVADNVLQRHVAASEMLPRYAATGQAVSGEACDGCLCDHTAWRGEQGRQTHRPTRMCSWCPDGARVQAPAAKTNWLGLRAARPRGVSTVAQNPLHGPRSWVPCDRRCSPAARVTLAEPPVSCRLATHGDGC